MLKLAALPKTEEKKKNQQCLLPSNDLKCVCSVYVCVCVCARARACEFRFAVRSPFLSPALAVTVTSQSPIPVLDHLISGGLTRR